MMRATALESTSLMRGLTGRRAPEAGEAGLAASWRHGSGKPLTTAGLASKVRQIE